MDYGKERTLQLELFPTLRLVLPVQIRFQYNVSQALTIVSILP